MSSPDLAAYQQNDCGPEGAFLLETVENGVLCPRLESPCCDFKVAMNRAAFFTCQTQPARSLKL